MLPINCNIEATKMQGFESATLLFTENVCTQPEIITGSPKIMMDELIIRTIDESSFRKLFAEMNAMARVAAVQKIKFSVRSR